MKKSLCKDLHNSRKCSRLIFCNQLTKYSLFLLSLWAMIKHRTKNSYSITVRSCCRAHLTLFISAHPFFISRCSLKTNQLHCARLTFFHRTVSKQKAIWRNLTVSQYFKPVVKMDSQTGKNFCYSKVYAVMLIFHSRRMLLSFLWE